MPVKSSEHIEDSDLKGITELLKSSQPTIRIFREGNLFGMFIGGLALLGGFISFLLGLTGTVSWIIDAETISMRLFNASPGAVFSVIGLIVMIKYKPRVKSEIEIHVKTQKSKDKTEYSEISVSHKTAASSPVSATPLRPPDILGRGFLR